MSLRRSEGFQRHPTSQPPHCYLITGLNQGEQGLLTLGESLPGGRKVAGRMDVAPHVRCGVPRRTGAVGESLTTSGPACSKTAQHKLSARVWCIRFESCP